MKGCGIILSPLDRFTHAPIEHLYSLPFVEHVLCDIGVLTDSRPLYFDYAPFMNDKGLLQSPKELAEFLVWLSDKRITSYAEIGVHYGTTWNVITAYLRRLGLTHSYGIDPNPPREILFPEMVYLQGTSEQHKLQVDLVFIDGDHSYSWAKRDYVNTDASYYAFHDIYDTDVARHCKPSCADFYHEIKKEYNYTEFSYKSGAFGIGVVYV